MAEEKTEKVEQPPVSMQVVVPVPVKKSDPIEDIVATFDQIFQNVQSAGMRSLKNAAVQFKEKADAVIGKLDVGGDPPSKS